jgi:SAM-dependent methyltransferase
MPLTLSRTPLAMSWSEKLLQSLSRDPGAGSDAAPHPAVTVDSALDGLLEVYPRFLDLVRERDVLDFGCGEGYQAVAMALQGARSVTGVDTNARLLGTGRALAQEHDAQERTRFVERLERERHHGAFDLVVSQNSMEHFPDPGAVLREMRAVLRPGGLVFLTFSPPWLAPYGSHMQFFTPVPWVHLLFSERTVMAVRTRYRSDGAKRYEDVEGGLNRMTLAKFERLIRDSRLRILWRRYDPVKGIPLVRSVPLLREILVNRVTCLLEKPA